MQKTKGPHPPHLFWTLGNADNQVREVLSGFTNEG
jgi:hypothetical protein